jgi:hypothetical protein
MTATKLTKAQERYLYEIRQVGECVYNNRARKPLEALEAAGLITVDWDMRAQTKGGGIELVGRNVAKPTGHITIKLGLAPPKKPGSSNRIERNWTLIIARSNHNADHVALFATHADDPEGAQKVANEALPTWGLSPVVWEPVGHGFKAGPITIYQTKTAKENT